MVDKTNNPIEVFSMLPGAEFVLEGSDPVLQVPIGHNNADFARDIIDTIKTDLTDGVDPAEVMVDTTHDRKLTLERLETPLGGLSVFSQTIGAGKPEIHHVSVRPPKAHNP